LRLYTGNMLQQTQISKIGAQVSLDFPSKIYLDMTPDCNLHCIMCRDSIENSGRIMEFELLKGL
jgi:MoaA/NifB/PqqE/SkfB family radical SAM enzyme